MKPNINLFACLVLATLACFSVRFTFGQRALDSMYKVDHLESFSYSHQVNRFGFSDIFQDEKNQSSVSIILYQTPVELAVEDLLNDEYIISLLGDSASTIGSPELIQIGDLNGVFIDFISSRSGLKIRSLSFSWVEKNDIYNISLHLHDSSHNTINSLTFFLNVVSSFKLLAP